MFDDASLASHNRARDNVNLAKHFARKSFFATGNAAPLDEFMSWAMLGLMKAAMKFKRARKVKFATFASTKIKWEIISGIRERAKAMNKYDSLDVHIENGLQPPSHEDFSPEAMADRHEVIEAVHAAINALPVVEREIVTLYDIELLSQEDIAKRFDRCSSWVSITRTRALKSMRKYLESWFNNRRA
jgi:RNA polymerase sigma factor (sigma-70 family)